MAEKLGKAIRLSKIIIILQHGQKQALAKTAGTEKQELVAGFLQQGNQVGPISVEIALADNFLKVADAVRELHEAMLNIGGRVQLDGAALEIFSSKYGRKGWELCQWEIQKNRKHRSSFFGRQGWFSGEQYHFTLHPFSLDKSWSRSIDWQE